MNSEKIILTPLLRELKKYSQKDPHLVSDMAILLSSMDSLPQAIELLETKLHTFSNQWLYLHFLLADQQYVKCLSMVESILPQLHNNLTSIVTFSYLKAQAYYGLKEHQKAKNLLLHLLEIEPDHFLAQDLLDQIEQKGITV